MTIRTAAKLASTAFVGGIASLALAVPAGAEPDAGGSGGGSLGPTPPIIDTGTAWEILPIATGAAGGIALAGLGLAAAAGVRRHQAHAHVPHAA